MRKNHVSNVLDRNDVLNNALTRTVYRVTYATLYPIYLVYNLIKGVTKLRSM